jgi:CheY-like chemotaxis protein/ribosomal protein S27E
MVGQLSDRVLLVDDEPLIRKVISAYLVAAGYVVRAAVDGLDALEKLRAGLPDLIISDLNMPRMSGIELLGVVRKRFPQIPVIVISGVASDEIPKEVTADAYYHKNGFGFEQLLQTISDLTRKPPLPTAPLHVDNKPVQARWDGDGHYVVECPDCLRSTMVLQSPRFTRGAPITTCIHCGGVIRLLIDDGNSAEGNGRIIPPTGYTATLG